MPSQCQAEDQRSPGFGRSCKTSRKPNILYVAEFEPGSTGHSIGPAKSVPPTSERRRTREKKTNSRNRSIPVSSQQSITFRKFQVNNIFEHDQVCYRIRPNRIIITVVILQIQQNSRNRKFRNATPQIQGRQLNSDRKTIVCRKDGTKTRPSIQKLLFANQIHRLTSGETENSVFGRPDRKHRGNNGSCRRSTVQAIRTDSTKLKQSSTRTKTPAYRNRQGGKSRAIAEIREQDRTRTAVLRYPFHASNSLVFLRKQFPAEMTCTVEDPDQRDVQISVTVPDDRSNHQQNNIHKQNVPDFQTVSFIFQLSRVINK